MGTFSKVYEALTTDKNFGTGFVNIKEYLFNTASREYQGLQQELVTNYGIISETVNYMIVTGQSFNYICQISTTSILILMS